MGGLINNLKIQAYFASTIGYYSDDITWCISRVKPIPLWLNMWQVVDKISWCLAFLSGYLNGFALYFVIRHDTNPVWLRKDLHYTIICMALPAFIGFAQNVQYHPKRNIIRFFIGFVLLQGVVISSLWNGFLVKRITHPMMGIQTVSIKQLISDDFRLVGNLFALHNIEQQNTVSIYHSCY